MDSLSQIAMKLPFALLLIIATQVAVHAQDPRVQMANLDHLAAKASQTVDVSIDQRMIQIAAKLLSNTNPDEAEAKKLVTGLKGIFVKSFEFDTDNQYSAADLESIRSQLRGPLWSRLLNVTSKKEGTVEVYILLNGDQVGGLTVLSAHLRELTVVNIIGPVDLDKLVKLEGQFGIPNLDIESSKPKTKNEK
ncbi:MAG TPA: DUF4252 domain-containing protein [Pyrinomonadaceae bacterium]